MNNEKVIMNESLMGYTKPFIHYSLLLLIYFTLQGIPVKTYAQPGMLGAQTITSSGVIVNEYTTLTSDASAGATSITVAHAALNDSSRFSGSLSAGELVMIVQMQGATMTTSDTSSTAWGAIASYNNAGLFEFDAVTSISGSTIINLAGALKNSYTASGNVQVIRVPRYSTLTVNSGASITTSSWNGSTGGVIAIEVNSTTTVNGTIDASGLGFRGGNAVDSSQCCPQGSDKFYTTTIKSDGAEKGESIGGTTATYDSLGGRYGRGAPANGGGGGNAHNSGGGGGANGDYGNGVTWNGLGIPDVSGGSGNNWKLAWNLEYSGFWSNVSSGGGRGGYSFSDDGSQDPTTVNPGKSAWAGDYRTKMGGYGGRPLNNSSGTRVFMGGGGGAGDENNGTGTNGGNGGGIVYMLIGGVISGSGSLNADGATVSTASGVDGAGGGGGGGTVMVYTTGLSATGLSLNATGGTGGSQSIGSGEDQAEGPGGGGGGGYASATSPNSFTTLTTPGAEGKTNATAISKFKPNGATEGDTGVVVPNPPNPYTSSVNLPVGLLNFAAIYINDAVEVDWTTASEINNDFFSVEKAVSPGPSEGGGLQFITIGTVPGAGNSTTERSYEFVDGTPFPLGTAGDGVILYYRLSQTDYDGKEQTFAPVAVRQYIKTESNALVSAENVPFSDYLKLNYTLTNTGNVGFSLFNSTGQLIRAEQTFAGKGTNAFSFDDLSSLSNGLYIVLMTTSDNQVFFLKVVKM